jgi:Major intrinsic protein
LLLGRKLFAEGLGAFLLAAAVIGSGIMAERLAGGNAAVALLANTGATIAALATLIAMLGPISGAHFNPVVSLVAAIRGELQSSQAVGYFIVQIVGCCAGAVLANAMFELPLVQTSLHARTGLAQWLAEVVATGGLVLVVLTSPSVREAAWRVSAWIGAAYLVAGEHERLGLGDVVFGNELAVDGKSRIAAVRHPVRHFSQLEGVSESGFYDGASAKVPQTLAFRDIAGSDFDPAMKLGRQQGH